MRYTFFLSLLFLPLLCSAQVWVGAHPDSIHVDSARVDTLHWQSAGRLKLIVDDMEHAVVVQDSAIYRLLDRTVNGSDQQVAEIDGFRVQIYSSNRQQAAKQEAIELEQKMKDLVHEPIYIQYATPFWRVRIGNFRTLQDASAFKEELLRQFPRMRSETYVVRDKIEVLL